MASADLPAVPPAVRRRPRRLAVFALAALAVLLVLLAVATLLGRHWLRAATRDALPQISGTLRTPGLGAPVTVSRNAQGVPSLHASSLPDLYFAQGFTTAQDRLFQMDTLRRHATGNLAELLGRALIPHDRAQRILSLGPAADRILTQLPPDQRLAFQRYADGVNAAIAATPHLPVEFRVLAYTPAPWTARDCVLVSLVLFEELTNTFPHKLDREALAAHLAPSASPELRAQLLEDLYPVGSWRDHPPAQPTTDVTTPLDSIPDVPLDPSQVRLQHLPHPPNLAKPLDLPNNNGVITTEAKRRGETRFSPPSSLLALNHLLAPACPACRAGSNNWAVSGVHTASGLPLLSNDMHLALTAPGTWYTVDLVTPALHVAGVSLPGVPFVLVGHNDHVAWGFTNLGADVQDLYIEHLRGPGPSAESQGTAATPITKAETEFLTPTGQWLPVHHRSELIRVRGGHTVTLDVLSTLHAGVDTPLITPLLLGEQRPISLLWSLYNTASASFPFATAASAGSGAELTQAFSTFTGPTLNLVWADDRNHIGYHAIGRIPVRNSLSSPGPLSPVPIDIAASAGLASPNHEWAGFIPFDQLPAVVDPAGGIIATANSRITPDNYPFPVTLDWVSAYRTERIWHGLTGRTGLQPADMLPLQTDIHSESDKLIAHRLAYSIDHTPDDRIHAKGGTPRQLRQAADLLRNWNGDLRADTPAPLISAAARSALWSLLLTPKLTVPASTATPGETAAESQNLLALYDWFERDVAEEQIVAHLPARWLPSTFPNWDDLLATAVIHGLAVVHAPRDPSKLRYGRVDPSTGSPDRSNFELPLFAQSVVLRRLIGLPTGSGPLTLSGNGRTVWQTHRNFGPSECFTADLAHRDAATLVLPMGESGNPSSPFFRDQLPSWLNGSTFPLPFGSAPAVSTLILQP